MDTISISNLYNLDRFNFTTSLEKEQTAFFDIRYALHILPEWDINQSLRFIYAKSAYQCFRQR